ncbi:hypothetical protein M885DRAFT_512443 [Pelagophyceae sp. CCMP2097]|nr:hypothetical protein M885DRAFT_512443 [Pelagophyceae sp. CCMP2097]
MRRCTSSTTPRTAACRCSAGTTGSAMCVQRRGGSAPCASKGPLTVFGSGRPTFASTRWRSQAQIGSRRTS